ncbi:unnamed protein product [Rotaria sordida]|uniref:DUF4378 domain-containing protein n=1 Tax=Rotaria sordida TaxID=392033 RepID=A0A814DR87_9BILA|nr:unnamed protein product [Rotaria sordida]
MLPISSSNHHTHMDTSWKTYYDAKKILRQTEQRLKDTRDYYPHVHLNNHYDNNNNNNDLSTFSSSSSFLLHGGGGDTSSIHAGNRSMLNEDRMINNKHQQILDSDALQTIRRKISKQKIAAERRAEHLFHSQSDAGHMFESYRPHSTYSTSASLQNLHYSPYRQQRISPPKLQPSYTSHLSQSQSFPSELDTVLRTSTSSKILHKENDIVRTNDFERQTFHQPITRKMTKVLPKDNYSLSNGRSTQQRSTSASNSLTTKYQDLHSSHFLTPTDSQRLKHIHRIESTHIPSGSGVKTNLITSDSWQTDPIVTKKSSTISQQEKPLKKKPASELISKRTKTDIEESLGHTNQRTEKILKPKRDTSASKPLGIITEKPPLPKPKSDDENKRLEDLIQQKRQQHEDFLLNEKRLRDEQDKIRKDKFKKLNEPIKETSHQYLQSSLTKRTSPFTPITPKDLTGQTRQRLLHLLGSSTDYHTNNSFEPPSSLDRCSSSSSSISSSSSNDSVIEVQSTKPNDPLIVRSRSEPPIQNGAINNNVQRHENLLRWAVNLTRDCDLVENRFKYLRSNGTQPFDTISSSYQHDDGNLRYQTSHYEINNSETIRPSTLTHLSERLNSVHLNDYQNQPLTNINDHQDLLLERHIYHDRAAAKIQAAYRGYTVRKSLPWLNDKQKYFHDDFNKRPIHHRDTSSINMDIRLTNDNFPIDSTHLRYHENPTINDYQQQQQQPIRKIITLPLYSDDYDNIPNAPISNLSTPINHKQIPIITSNFSLDLPNINSSIITTPILSPELHVPSQNERRRSISPPLPPQMSPDNGRPLQHLIQTTTSQHSIDEHIDTTKRLKTNLRSQNSPLNILSQQQQPIRKSPVQQSSSSSSSSTITNRKRRSPSPQQQQQTMTTAHSRHRTSHNSSPPSSSSESILTAREKRVRQKFNSDIELQAYEKRLKDIEKKIRQLVKRAFEIFDEKRSISSPPTVTRTTKTDLLSHNRSKSTNHFQDESSISDGTSIHRKDTEFLIKKDNDISSTSTQQRQSDVVTSDASDLERRVHAYREQLKAKKFELERLKQRKNKEILRRQEDELKKQIQSCDYEIQTLRLQPIQQEQTVPVPSPSIHSNSLTETTKSSLPKTIKSDKQILSPKQDIFDNNEEKEVEGRLLETPHDERDTQQDALSISVTTDLPIESETDHDSRHASIHNETPIVNVNLNTSISSKERKDSTSLSSSSSSITSEKFIKSLSPQISRSPSPSLSLSQEHIKSPSPPPPPPPAREHIKSPSSLVQERIKTLSQEQFFIPINERKQSQHSSINNDYDEDFSEVTHSPIHTPTNIQTDDINIESIKEDIDDKSSIHDSNKSLSSKSSGDEQSEILVLVKKSANNTPRQQDEKIFENKLPTPTPSPPPPPQLPLLPTKIESDDTSHDISEVDQGNKRIEQENKIDQLTEILVRTLIDEAIDQGKEIEKLKIKNSLTKEASEWIPVEDLASEENNKQISTNHEDDVDNDVQTLSKEPPDVLELSDATTNETNEDEELKIDLTPLIDDNLDEQRDLNSRKLIDTGSTIHGNDETTTNVTEESIQSISEVPIKPVVSHTREQVIQLCHEAISILYNQNNDFSDRSTINRTIPDSYFNYEQQDSDNEDIQCSRHAYYRMIFDLCVELLYEMHSSNVRVTTYPEWQKPKLIRKRFYRAHKPNNRDEAENFIQRKVLEILNLMPRQITHPKWRISIGRYQDAEQFENVLDEELRRTESQWIDYEDDCLRIKFDIAEYIFDRLIQETFIECFHVVNKRLALSSNSTGL